MNQQGIIRKGATGSIAMAICTIGGDLLGLVCSVLTGAILIPWLGAVIPWLAGLFLNRLHHDLWLFSLIIILLLILVVAGLFYTIDTKGPIKERIKAFGEVMGGSIIIFGSIYLLLGLIFQVHIPLGFIATAHLGAFPLVMPYVTHPDRTLAIVWLVYYLLVHLLSLVPSEMEGKIAHLPLSRPIPEGPREQYVRECYHHLEHALMAWDPPLLERVVWPSFAYYEGPGPLLWQGRTLIISEVLLDPTQTEVFLPALAREIARFNGPDRWLEGLMTSFPRRGLLILGITGNWIWLPAMISTDWWAHWQGERVLDIDSFVHAAGQSAWLLHDLRKKRYENQQAGLADTSWPTLLERIDQLEMLMGKEEIQMKNQNIKRANPQIANGAPPPPKQIKQRKTGTEPQ